MDSTVNQMQKSKINLPAGKAGNQIIGRFYTIVLLLYLVILFIGSLPTIPLPHNQRLFVVSSGSMEPTLHIGSVVITRPLRDYQVGDIITFSNPDKSKGEKKTTTHRIEKIINQNGKTVYMTKGDANVLSDGKFTPHGQVIGKVTRQIAYLGFWVNIIKSKLGLVFLVFIPGMIIVVREIKNITLSFRAKTRNL